MIDRCCSAPVWSRGHARNCTATAAAAAAAISPVPVVWQGVLLPPAANRDRKLRVAVLHGPSAAIGSLAGTAAMLAWLIAHGEAPVAYQASMVACGAGAAAWLLWRRLHRP